MAPDGNGPKLVFQKVPEAKVAKNRIHLDLIVGDAIDAEVERFVALGRAALEEAEIDGDGSHLDRARGSRGQRAVPLHDVS